MTREDGLDLAFTLASSLIDLRLRHTGDAPTEETPRGATQCGRALRFLVAMEFGLKENCGQRTGSGKGVEPAREVEPLTC